LIFFYFTKSTLIYNWDLICFQLDIHERRIELKEEMEKSLYSASRQLGLEANKSVKLEQTAQWGFFFRITLKEEKVLRGNKDFQVSNLSN